MGLTSDRIPYAKPGLPNPELISVLTDSMD